MLNSLSFLNIMQHVLQCRRQQVGTHCLNRSVTQPRHSDNPNADWKRRCSVWPMGVIWLCTR